MKNSECPNLFYREAMAKISAAEKQRLYRQRRDANVNVYVNITKRKHQKSTTSKDEFTALSELQRPVPSFLALVCLH